ncbi:histone deacetylase complex subunit SAP130-B isoform X2 [Nematostella vectensis]|uniref:histone deacetylase complex subunit SAP130-B isoform X2 n=1 Tax=Nematostella vectensis TaxID=45351 RepID=UPI002076EBE8|nr:histone deacetylase complex subunit SAP130-B isoform X2 [Nematostella vectensis]
MSYPGEERDSSNAPISASRNPPPGSTVEKDKTQEKPKALGGQSSGEGHHGTRPLDMAATMKVGKAAPVLNRPIAPAAATSSNVLAMGGHIGSSYMPGFGVQGHPLVNPAIPLQASMLRGAMSPHHPFSPHVPVGAAAAALAGAPPRSLSSIRSAIKPRVTTHHQGPISTTPSVHPQASATTSAPAVAPIASTAAFYQQSGEHKQEIRDVRPSLVTDLARHAGSPHVSATPTAAGVSAHPIPVATSKVPPSGVSSAPHKPAQPGLLAHFSQTHSPLHMPTSAAAGSIAQGGIVSGGVVSMGGQPPKAAPSPVSVAAVTSKMYSHMNFSKQGQQSEMAQQSGELSRLSSKSSGKASPGPAQAHITAVTTMSTSHAVPASSPMHAAMVSDGRADRPHQQVPLANPMYHPGIPAPYMFGPEHLGYPIHIGPYGPPPSGIRVSHAVTTASAQGAAATATVMNPAIIMDQTRYIALTQQAAAGFGGLATNCMAGDVPGSSSMMDVTTPSSGIYSMPVLGVPPASSGIPVSISTSNPNATSPRPSILRKRTSEGLRKPTIVPYNDGGAPSSQAEKPGSPRSDTTTLSAPQSGQNSPKPPSDAGSQSNDQVAPSTTPTTTQEPPKPADPSAPVTVKKEQGESAAATPTPTTTTVAPTATDKPAVSLPDGASPRKKPRKQNVVVTEDKYGSTVPIEETLSEEDDKKKLAAQSEEASQLDEDLKFILLKRPKISIFGGYKVNTKAAHNHFLRYSDVKLKDDRKPTIQDLANQKGVAHRLSGWRVQHIAAQMDELNTVEQEVLKKLFELRDKLPRPRQGQKPSKFQDELLMLDELIQGNIQRSQLVSEQLSDSRKTMVKVLEHRPRCVDIIQKYINKRNPKKKS